MSQIHAIKEVKVGIDFGDGLTPVGRLAIRDRQIYFEYNRAFIDKGPEISPRHLPLKSGVRHFERDPFDTLPGVLMTVCPMGGGGCCLTGLPALKV